MIDRPPPADIAQGILLARNEHKPESETARFTDWLARGAPGLRLPVLADGSPPPESAHPIPGEARIFNQNGFFAASELVSGQQASTLHTPVPIMQEDEIAVPADVTTSASSSAVASSRVFATDARSGSAFDDLGSMPAPAKPAAMARDAELAGKVVEFDVNLVPSAGAEAVADIEQPAPAADVRSYRAGAQSALRVAIRDIERGLQILVAAEMLSREERDHLTQEIAALLSRYGLVARDVRVTGAARAGNSGKS